MKIPVQEAVLLLKKGDVVAIPTETVYGLAAGLFQKQAIKKIFHIKQRPHDNPLLIHISNLTELDELAHDFPPHTNELTATFWPGPLTLILPATTIISKDVRARLPTAAFRMPSHPIALEILQQTGPLVAPSANLSGKPSATDYHAVEEDFGPSFPVVDGGSCEGGIESTILGYRGRKWVIFREGLISAEDLSLVLGYLPNTYHSTKIVSPGQKYPHYSPNAILLLSTNYDHTSPLPILGFEDRKYDSKSPLITMGPLHNPNHVLKNLYTSLRSLDHQGFSKVWVDVNFDSTGPLKVLKHRLFKAASAI